MTKKIAAVFLILCMLLPFVPSSAASGGVPLTGETINVYNWGLYIADGTDGSLNVNEEFTRRTGIKVNYTTFETNESLYTKLKTGGASYDIIIPSDYMVEKLIAEDMLLPLDYANIPNAAKIDESFRGMGHDPEDKFSVPYTWGAVGLIYNKKYVTKEVTSWSAMWDPEYKGKILMFDNPRDAFGVAQLLLGIDVNTASKDEIDRAAEKLAEQKELVQSYVMDQIFSQMQNEEAWVAAYYAGDYLTMAEENENLEFVFPEEGYNLFVDAMCIPKGSRNKSAAEKYINFLCDPEISGRNMEFLGYSTPISEAKDYMDEELADNKYAYPDEETLARGVIFENLPEEINSYMGEKFNAVKTSGSGWSLYVFIGIGAAAVAFGLYMYLRKKKRDSY